MCSFIHGKLNKIRDFFILLWLTLSSLLKYSFFAALMILLYKFLNVLYLEMLAGFGNLNEMLPSSILVLLEVSMPLVIHGSILLKLRLNFFEIMGMCKLYNM